MWAGQQRTPTPFGLATPKPVFGGWRGGHTEGLRRRCGEVAGAELGAHPVDRFMVNVGTTLRLPSPPHGQCGEGQARCRLMASGWGGGSVVVRGRESRLHGEGTQRVSSDTKAMAGDRWRTPVICGPASARPSLGYCVCRPSCTNGRPTALIVGSVTVQPRRRSRLPCGGVASGARQSWSTIGRSRWRETSRHRLRGPGARRCEMTSRPSGSGPFPCGSG